MIEKDLDTALKEGIYAKRTVMKAIKLKDVWEENYNRYGQKVRYKKYFI